MKKYKVSFYIDEDFEVEAPTREEATESAVAQLAGCGWYERNDISDFMEKCANVEEIKEEE
jgi:hypothetical protein